jgi:hypothetical protein
MVPNPSICLQFVAIAYFMIAGERRPRRSPAQVAKSQYGLVP